MILLTLVSMSLYAMVFQGRPGFIWGLYAVPALMFYLARIWIRRSSRFGIDVLRFDEGCRNFEFCRGSEVIAFRAEDARFLRQEGGENFFDVRGATLSFPVRVYGGRNFRAEAIRLGDFGGRNFTVVDFQDGRLKVWRETLLGKIYY